jgi:hypothetical protein
MEYTESRHDSKQANMSQKLLRPMKLFPGSFVFISEEQID